ncbi:MAG: hypothetical protein AVDCRST_MAG73-3916, partial [uncultured Thermomicrobiales bacterium]
GGGPQHGRDVGGGGVPGFGGGERVAGRGAVAAVGALRVVSRGDAAAVPVSARVFAAGERGAVHHLDPLHNRAAGADPGRRRTRLRQHTGDGAGAGAGGIGRDGGQLCSGPRGVQHRDGQLV